jgi:3-oxoacyl-ACP reductase-like protein
MGIFDTLKNAIFGGQPQAKPAPGAATSQVPGAATPSARTAGAAPTSAAAQGSAGAAAATPAAPVDIEQVLTDMAAKKPEKLNWQSSIVDLMKLVDLDPSLSNRKELAGELGYTGDTQDSAKMNIWLHHEVMEKLAASGGKVPDSLRH